MEENFNSSEFPSETVEQRNKTISILVIISLASIPVIAVILEILCYYFLQHPNFSTRVGKGNAVYTTNFLYFLAGGENFSSAAAIGIFATIIIHIAVCSVIRCRLYEVEKMTNENYSLMNVIFYHPFKKFWIFKTQSDQYFADDESLQKFYRIMYFRIIWTVCILVILGIIVLIANMG